MSSNNNNSPKKGIAKTGSTRDIFKQLYKEPKVFKAKDYAPQKYQFTVARKELAAYAFLCRQQEAREWGQLVLKETFPENTQQAADSKSEALMKRSYKSDLFPVLRDGIRLCKIINLVKPGTITKIADSVGKPFLMLDNINFFLKALKDLGIPDHESFLPLDLLERKNMPRVVYCIHRMAATFYQKYGFGAKIEEKTGAYQFSEDELEKASRDLEEAENEPGSRKSQNVQNLQKQLEEQQLLLQQQEEAARELALARLQEIRRHNEEEVEHSRQLFFLNQITPASVVIEGFSRSEDVSGSKDADYSMKATVTYTDGSVETKNFLFNTGTHDWEQAIGSVNQGSTKKLIEKIEVVPVFNNDTHQGKVWFDRVSIAENRPQPNYIQFVQNSSFEQSDEQETVAYLWEAETSGKGKTYVRTSDNHAPTGGQWSIRLASDDSSSSTKANTYVSIFQNEAAPVVIEAWTKIEHLGSKSGNAFLGIRGTLVFDDDSKENVVLNVLPAEAPAADAPWQRKFLYVTPSKPLKGVNLSAEFSGAEGAVLFDSVTLSQEEWKQHVLNPSFEEVKAAEGTEHVADWNTEGTHAPQVSYNNWVLYGHTSIECNNENTKDYSLVSQRIILNQKEARQITFEGWSKAENVGGLPDADYSIRVDVLLQDGSKDVIESSPFTTGTHDFESRTFVYVPPADKPIKEATVQAIFKNHTGRVWFDNITANEEYLFGESEIFMLQKILKSLNFEKDLIEDIAELKRQMLLEVRKNYQLERELAAIEKKIALLIKNRIDVQEVLQASKRLAKLFKWKSKKDNANAPQSAVIDFVKKKANKYQELFYLLQTEPRYLARLVTLISPAQMEEFLDTIVLTLFGDAYSPREEYLLLRILQEATYNEIVTFKDITGFLEANTVIAKMIVTYSRREQGHLYLVKTLAPLLQRFVHTKDLDFELSPMRVWNTSISEEEIASGEKSKRERVTSDEEAMKHPEVVQTLNERVDKLLDITQWFLDEIFKTVEHVPYGLRWISKQIPEISKKKFPKSSLEDIQKIVGYFIYYRFLNPAIVSPDLYDIIRLNLSTNQRRNLVQVSKALQCLFNFANFGDSKINKHIEKINAFIQQNKEKVSAYLSKIVEVPEPADHLMVDNYIELTQGSKPLIVVTFDEVYSTHEALLKNLDQVAKDSKDVLRLIVNDLGPLPEYDMSEEDSDREIQLTLTNPVSEQTAQKELQEEKQSVLSQTRRMTIELMRIMDVDNTSPNLLEFLNNAKRISKKNDNIKTLLDNILANIDQMEKAEKRDKHEIAATVMQEVEVYVENEATQRIARKNLISRLKLGLENLLRNQKYMNEQMEQFNIYLNTVRAQQSAKKSKKEKKKKVKFTYKKLEKQGIILRSIVPGKSQKTCTFSICATENPNEFTVTAKIAGITADTISLLLDDLLEKQSQGITQLDLDSVTLDVNLTIHMLNKLFYQK